MQYLEAFITFLKETNTGLSPLTCKNYRADVKKFIDWISAKYSFFDTTSLSDADIEEFLSECKAHNATASLSRYRSSLKLFFTYLDHEGLVANNPFNAPADKKISQPDPYRMQEFRNYLFLNQASHLTVKNYIIDIRQFLSWMQENHLRDISPNLVDRYHQSLTDAQTLSESSIGRKVSAVKKYVQWHDLPETLPDQLLMRQGERQPAEAGHKLTSTHIPALLRHARNLQKQTPEEEQLMPPLITPYSSFPPFRLTQKIMRGLSQASEHMVVTPLVGIIRRIKSHTLSSQELFIQKWQSGPYADSSLFNKLFFHLRYTRPNWYRRWQKTALSQYFNMLILLIFAVIVGVGFYVSFIQKPLPGLAASPVAPLRILSFQGKLTDTNDNPTTTSQWVRFIIYNDQSASGSARLWEEDDYVTPDSDGVFSILLGSNGSGGNAALCNSGNPPTSPATGACGIPQSLFAQNNALWMGVTIGNTAELTPRQQLATVSYATNAEVLQGLPPTTDTADATSNNNAVLALNSSGTVSISGSASPTTIQYTGNQFNLVGKVLALESAPGTNTNVQIIPDGTGQIDLQKPLQNSTLNGNLKSASTGTYTDSGAVEVDDLFAVLATSSGQSAFSIDQEGAGPLISASSSGTAKFTIDNSGNLSNAGNITTSGNLVLSNSSATTTFGGITYTWPTGGQANGFVLTTNGTGTLSWATAAGNYWQLNSKVLSPINTTYDLAVGGSATGSASFQIFALAGALQPAGSASSSGNLVLTGSSSKVDLLNNTSLGFYNSANGDAGLDGNPSLFISNNGSNGIGYVGIDTNSASNPLQVNGAIGIQNSNTITGVSSYTQFNNGISVGGGTTYNVTSGGVANLASGSNVVNSGASYFQVGSTGGSGSYARLYADLSNVGDFALTDGSGNAYLYTNVAGASLVPAGSTGIGKNVTSPHAVLDVEGGNTGGNAALIVNQNGATTNDILDASSSGAIKFGIAYDGTLTDVKYNTDKGLLYMNGTGGLVAETAQGASHTVLHGNGTSAPNFSAVDLTADVGTSILPLANGGTNNNLVANNGGVVYSDASKLQILAGTAIAGQCLVSGSSAAPSWGSCGGAGYWTLTTPGNGAITPINSTWDLLLGGNATTSAKFAVLNMNTGTPVASISATSSGTGIVLGGDGTIQATRMNNLTIGGSPSGGVGTGDIILSPRGSASTGAIDLNAGTIALGGVDTTISNTGTSKLTLNSGSTGNIYFTNTNSSITSGGNLTLAGTISLPNSNTITGFSSSYVQLNNGLALAGGTTYVLNNSTSNLNSLTLAGTLAVNQTGAAGTKTNIDFSGNVLPGSSGGANIGSGALPWNYVYANNLVLSPSAINDGFWQLNSKVLSPYYNSNDLAIGGTATGSAAFQVFTLVSPLETAGTASSSGNLVFTGTATRTNLLNGSTFGIYQSLNGDAGLSTTPAFYITNTGNVGVNTNAPGGKFDVEATLNPTSADTIGLLTQNNVTAASGTYGVYGAQFIGNANDSSGADTQTFLAGLKATAKNSNASIITTAQGVWGTIANTANGTINSGYALRAYVNNSSSGTIGSGYGLYVDPAANTGTFTYDAGVFINNQTAAVNNSNLVIGSSIPTSNYSIYNASAYSNYFAGNVGIGTQSAQASLHVSDGTNDAFMVNQTTSTNLVQNPSFEGNSLTGWTTGTHYTASQDTAEFGSYSLKFNGTSVSDSEYGPCITVTGNTTYALSAYIYRVSGYTGNTTIDWIEYSGAACTTQVVDGANVGTTTTNKWVRASEVFTTGSSTIGIRVRFVNDGTSTGTAYADGFQLEKSSIVSPYLDGSFGPGYYWTGTPNNSSSVRTQGADLAYEPLNSTQGIGAAGNSIAPVLQLDQDGSGDLLDASAAGVMKMRIDSSGNLYAPRFIDSNNTAGSYFLDPAATDYSLVTAGDVGIKTDTSQPQLALTIGPGSNAGTELTNPQSPSATAVSGGSLTNSTTYYYEITASDGVGETIPSAQTSANTGTGNDTINLSWTAVVGAHSYKIYRTTTSGTYGATSFLKSVTTNSAVDDGTVALTSGTPPTNTTAYVNYIAASGNSWLGSEGNDLTLGDGTNNTTYLNAAGTRTFFGYNGASAGWLTIQSSGGHGMEFNVNSTSFGSGTTAMYINGASAGVGIQTTLTGNGALTVNQPNSAGDIFSASSSATTRFVISNAGYVGVGTNNPNSIFDVEGTTPSTSVGASYIQSTLSTANANYPSTLVVNNYFSGTGTQTGLIGMSAAGNLQSSGTISVAYGVEGFAANNSSSGTITSALDVVGQGWNNSTGTFTTNTDFYAAAPGAGTIGTNYAFISASGAGSSGFGTTTPGTGNTTGSTTVEVAGSLTLADVSNPVLAIHSNLGGSDQYEWYGDANATASELGLYDRTATHYDLLVDSTGNVDTHTGQIEIHGVPVIDLSTSVYYKGNNNKIYWQPHDGFNEMSLSTDGTLRIRSYLYIGSSIDLAENILTDDTSISAGDLLVDNASATAATDSATRSSSPYQQSLLGVVSTNPGIMLGTKVDSNLDDIDSPYAKPLVLAGRVPTKVSTLAGPILKGQLITSSALPGIGEKSTDVGVTVGTALEDFDPSKLTCTSVSSLQNIVWPADDGTNPAKPCFKLPDGTYVGKIMMLVKVSWDDAQTYMANTNTASFDYDPTKKTYTLVDSLAGQISRVGEYAQLAIADVEAGMVNAQQITSNSLAVATNNVTIAGQSLNNYIISVVNQAINSGAIQQIAQNQPISPLAQSTQVQTNLISPLATGSAIALKLDQNQISVLGGSIASSSAVATIDNQGNATFSGSLNAQNLNVNNSATIAGSLNSQNLAVNGDATIAGTLHADRIEANSIVGLDALLSTLSAQKINNVNNISFAPPSGSPPDSNQSLFDSLSSATASGVLTDNFMPPDALASLSADLSYVPNLQAQTAVFEQGLQSAGQTLLSDTEIAGQLNVGSTLILADNAINTIGADLQIQSQQQGNVLFEGGKIAIDTNGNLTVNGSATFTKTLYANVISPLPNQNLNVQLGDTSSSSNSGLMVHNASGSAVFQLNQLGDLIASGTATIGKLNLSVAQPAYALSDTEVVATGSAGTTQINAYQTEVTIDNPAVTANSLIYITPVGSPPANAPSLLRQIPGLSFTVGVPVMQTTPIQFNWLIVN